ncbi:Eisosome component PIL1-domain-containing protein [Phlyctochytrium arcticum]|nr:Eisosome component PIL1-domain-containing protein [Phlyctochytrium arcticum]
MASFQSLRRSMVSLNAPDHPELTVLITEEKDVMKTLQKYSKEKVEAGKYMAVWGKTEHADLTDITEKYSTLFEEFSKFHSNLVEGYDGYRVRLKEMKTREDSLHGLRKRFKDLQDKFKDAIKKQKPTEGLKLELTAVDRELAEQEAAFESFKRAKFKEAMHLQFDSFLEFGSKIAIFATFGKYMTDQIPQGMLAPGQELPSYEGSPVTTRIIADFLKAIREFDQQTSAPAGTELGNGHTSHPHSRSHSGDGVLSAERGMSSLSLHSSPERTSEPYEEKPQPPSKRYNAAQRMSSAESFHVPGGFPADGPPTAYGTPPGRVPNEPRRFFQAPLPTYGQALYGQVPEMPTMSTSPGHSYMPSSHATSPHGSYSSLPRHLPAHSPNSSGTYMPSSHSLTRDYSSPSVLPPQQHAAGFYPPSSVGPPQHHVPGLYPPSSVGPPADAVSCPVCNRYVPSGFINDHLDSSCALHLIQPTRMDHNDTITDDEIRARMERFKS